MLPAILAVVLLCSATAFAQGEEHDQAKAPATPRWVSEKGYWIVESNIHVPKQYIVRFYNNDHTLVYKEEIKGMTLKLERRKVKMHLKQVLEAALYAWTKQQQAKENEGWVVQAMH